MMKQTPQKTLNRTYTFEGKGLHTGVISHITLKPASENTGIVFIRTDIGEGAKVRALAENVSNTARSTTLSEGSASVSTVEHILSALTGLGVDNAIVEIDNIEVPILDGSARPYVEAISNDGLKDQAEYRRYIELEKEIEIKDEKSGAYLRITPSDRPQFDLTVDFNSNVLGVQHILWDEDMEYSKEIAPCRTFVFLHELEFLASQGLVKGGDVDNAIVVVEHPVTEEQLDKLCSLFNKPRLSVNEGYLNNLVLHFPDECGRHKMLDLIGDLRLCGGYLNAKVTAFKSGHTINTLTAKAVREALNQ